MNLTAKTLFKIGSVSIMFIGAGHTILHLTLSGKDPATASIIQQLADFKLNIIGIGSRSMLDFYKGFSLTMGMLLFLTGLQNFFISGSLQSAFGNNKGIIIVPVLLAGMMFILSLIYFIILPQAFSLIAFVAYSMSWWKLKKEKVV